MQKNNEDSTHKRLLGAMIVAIVILGVLIVAICLDLREKGKLPIFQKKVANVTVSEPQSDERVSLPFTIKGTARVFESVVNVRIYEEESKEVIYEDIAYANALDAGQFGDFEISIDYLLKRPTASKVVAETYWVSPKDGEHMDVVRTPLTLNLYNLLNIDLFFTKSNNEGTDCSKVYPVNRVITDTGRPAETVLSALNLLVAGPRFVEQGESYSSLINTDAKIKNLLIEDDVAKIDFANQIEANAGGSCNVTAIRSQIERTATQFPSVKSVEISVDGDSESILQP